MLKMQRSTAAIPILVCTAALQIVREQEGYLVSQGVHVVYKPFEIDDLLANVKQLLGSQEHVSSVIKEERKKHQ
jgi:response regulator RpfG family c-di-GMP phosphodiesterase